MGTRFSDYEYEEPIDVAESGDDFRLLKYGIKNLITGKAFSYKVEIAKSALSSKGGNVLPTQIQDAVDTDGRSLVEKGLRQDLEYETHITVNSINIAAVSTVGGVSIDVRNRFL